MFGQIFKSEKAQNNSDRVQNVTNKPFRVDFISPARKDSATFTIFALVVRLQQVLRGIPIRCELNDNRT